MSVLLRIRDAHKSFGSQVILDGAEVTVSKDTKIGFVGRNGSGKSTLLRIILGEEELDSGEVIHSSKLRIGYLRQHDPFLPGESTLDFLMRDSGRPDWKCGAVAGQFELKGSDLEGPVSRLSGGWQTRVKLAALLLHEPNLLLLDEPTNFLDLRTQILLEHFLRGFTQACLIVSHDRGFLRSTCTQTLNLSRGTLTMFPGKIDAFLENLRQRRDHDERVNATVNAKKRQLQQFIDKNRANASTAAQAKSKSKQLRRLETKEILIDEPTARIRAPVVNPRQGPAVRCHNLAIGYGDHIVAEKIDLEIEHGQRAAVVGDNGEGKTTLLRTLVESLQPLRGGVRWGFGCDIGVYAQHVYTSLPEYVTVQEYLEHKAMPGTTNQQILAAAGALLFRDDHVRKKVSVLSGGERARLCLAGLLLGEYNVMVLDEPVNHLDVETVDALAEALIEYRGTVLFTSHDRHFMKRVGTSVIEVRDGSARHYAGDYDAYVYSVNKQIEEGERDQQRRRAGGAKKSNGDAAANGRRQWRANRRRLQKEIHNLERKIAQLDDKKNELNTQLLESTDPEEALRLHNELTEVDSNLTDAEDRWCELQEEHGDV